MSRFWHWTGVFPAVAAFALAFPAATLGQPASRIQSYHPYGNAPAYGHAPVATPSDEARNLQAAPLLNGPLDGGGSSASRGGPWEAFQTPSYGPAASRVQPASFQQPAARTLSSPAPAATIHAPLVESHHEPFMPFAPAGELPDGGYGSPACGPMGCGPEMHCATFCLPQFSLDNFSLFAGVHGFKGPANRGQEGSFGYHEGFNWGSCILGPDLGFQLGVQGVHSNFAGAADAAAGPFTAEDRDQVFVTTGVFRRVDHGFQAALVYDYMNDAWDYGLDLGQVRSQISFRHCSGAEFGFYNATTVQNDRNVIAPNDVWAPTDWYSFFFRKEFEQGGYGMVYAGWTDDSEGLLGAELVVPITCNWALGADFAYLSPEQARANRQEAWNVAWQIIWQPGGFGPCNYCRPLLNVANNGTFLFDRTR